MSDPQVAEFLRQGIIAAKAGNARQAEQLLRRVIAVDRNNEAAWLWMSSVVDDPADVVLCLENVLVINPSNEEARMALGWAKKAIGAQKAAAPAPPAAPVPVQPQTAAVSPGVAPAAPAPPGEVARDTINCPRCGYGNWKGNRSCARCNAALEVPRETLAQRPPPPPPAAAAPVPRLGEYLVKYAFITQDQLDEALKIQQAHEKKGSPRRLGEILLEMKALSPQRLEYAIRAQQRDFYASFND